MITYSEETKVQYGKIFTGKDHSYRGELKHFGFVMKAFMHTGYQVYYRDQYKGQIFVGHVAKITDAQECLDKFLGFTMA